MPKISELKKGDRILVPCIACGHKRSIVFQCLATYKLAKNRKCKECNNDINAEILVPQSRQFTKGGSAEMRNDG